MSKERRLALAKKLVDALEHDDEMGVEGLLNEIDALRENRLFQEIGRLTRQLHDTMASFTVDSKITSMTEYDIPDAKERLKYVMTMTEEAADKTLNVVEELMPVSQQLNHQAKELQDKWSRFLDREMPYQEFKDMSQELSEHFQSSKKSLEDVEQGLNDILMAQSFQDITGQIIRRVITLVQDLETSMVEMIRLSGASLDHQKLEETELPGPAVPGVDDKEGDVAHSQDEVDDLLSSLGF